MLLQVLGSAIMRWACEDAQQHVQSVVERRNKRSSELRASCWLAASARGPDARSKRRPASPLAATIMGRS